ncbi:MAG: hypothetical protein GXO04_02650 [Aquificae bacterium]|nr:hypothetical protein [Aquificota bacterium]
MKKGKVYEDIAVDYLKGKGYEILGRNLRTRFGEIDILAKRKGKFVVVEVKGGESFFPAERLTEGKLLRILRSAFELLGDAGFSVELVVVYRGRIYHYKNLGLGYEEVF